MKKRLFLFRRLKRFLYSRSFTRWPHFWETKFSVFSLKFPGHFKVFFPEQLVSEKFSGMHFWRSCHIFLMFLEFFQVFSTKIQISLSFPETLTIFQIPWFSRFSCFPGLWTLCSSCSQVGNKICRKSLSKYASCLVRF